MTIEERMRMIDKKADHDFEAEERKRIELEKRKEDAMQKIRDLKPRIDDVIKLANYAESKGISLRGRTAWGGHEGYDTGLFYSNSWSHLVGLISGKPITCMGIIAGGACGNTNFYTDGDRIFTNDGKEPILSHMESFIKRFDTFEECFYAFIDSKCKER